MRVHEPSYDVPSSGRSSVLGRVVDTPRLSPANFFQGVPPPSYSFVVQRRAPPLSDDGESVRSSTASEFDLQGDAQTFQEDLKKTEKTKTAPSATIVLSTRHRNQSPVPFIPSQPQPLQATAHLSASATRLNRTCITPVMVERPSLQQPKGYVFPKVEEN